MIPEDQSPPLPQKLDEIFASAIHTVGSPHRYYRVAAQRFLTYLQIHFPQVRSISELHRDPHLLGWIRVLCEEDPPLSNYSRRIYIIALRKLLRDFVPTGHPALFLPEDFRPRTPWRPGKPGPCKSSRPPLLHPIFGDIFEAQMQALKGSRKPCTISSYRAVARDFLLYLETRFPQVRQLSELRRDPHWIGWLRSLGEKQPPLSEITRQKYRLRLRALFQLLASHGQLLHDELLLIEDLPSPLRRMNQQLPHPTIGKIFDTQIQTLATTLRPNTIRTYRDTARSFLSFLDSHFAQLEHLAELRRAPHCLAWLRHLCEQERPLSNATRQGHVFRLRRLLNDLAFQGHVIEPALFLPEDLPPRPRYLPRALSPEDDQRLQTELRRNNDLLANALLLTRATGIRIGECIDLAIDCLRSVQQDQWAVHVPLGKLHTERLVPVDEDVLKMISRILVLRTESVLFRLANSASFLLPRPKGRARVYHGLRYALSCAAERAGCSRHVTCHMLRHTYATEMVRLGVNLPALMQLLGHKDIRMTLRYVQVTQQDLQREFHAARHNAVQWQLAPTLSLPHPESSSAGDAPAILQAIASTRHLLEMYRRQFGNEQTSKKLQRLGKRLLTVATDFGRLATR